VYTTLTKPSVRRVRTTTHDKLRAFMNAYWLRPENAFWMLLRSDALDAVPIRGPFADLSCGDGVFSFLHAGGRFTSDFDVFSSVANLQEVHTRSADIFDCVDADYQPGIASTPSMTVDCGTDIKTSMLDKASKLGLYERLVQHNNNERLPFDDCAFETVYCNAAYWVDQVDSFLSEVGRITAPAGTVVMHVKLDTIKQYTLADKRAMLGDRWLQLMDRGRIASWPSLCSQAEWEKRFDNAGLEIVGVQPIATATHAHVWDIGLRPIAPLLIKTMSQIQPHLRNEIKSEWVDLFCELARPFCSPDVELMGKPNGPAELQYVLTPRG
jgi:SAM-dependent methyltransferase